MPTSVELLAQQIEVLRQRVNAAVRTPQLTNSAIDDGSLTVSQGGTPVGYVGNQFDGSNGYLPLTGPIPPYPVAPTVDSVVGGIRVNWSGAVADPQPFYLSPVTIPTDVTRCDVEVSTDPAFPEHVDPRSPSDGSIMNLAGGSIKIAWPAAGATVYVRLRLKTAAGKRSDPGPTVSATTGEVGLGDLGFDINDYTGGTTVYYGTTDPSSSNTMVIGDLWLKQVAAGPPPQYETWRWTGATFVKLVDTGISSALASAAAAQTAADLKMRVFNQASPPSYSGASDTAMWFDSDDGNRPYRWNGTAWADNRLGNGAITPNSLVASNVIATGTITAALLQTLLVLTTAVVAGDINDEYTRLDGTGVVAYANDPGDLLPTELSRFGRGWSVRNSSTGLVKASATEDGALTAATLSVEDGEPEFGGITLSERLWDMPFGSLGYATIPSTGAWSPSYNAETEVIEFAFEVIDGRSYMVFHEPEEFRTQTGDAITCRLRRTTDGTKPTLTSPVFRDQTLAKTNGVNFIGAQTLLWRFDGATINGPVGVWRMLFTIEPANGATTMAFDQHRPTRISVLDIGPQSENIGVMRNGLAGNTAAVTTHVVEYGSTWSRSWRQSGPVSFDDPMYQGYGDSFNAIQKSACGFPSVTAELSGATVKKVEVYLYAEHWWNTGGGFARLGYHNQTAEPALYPASTGLIVSTFTARGQGKWIDVTSWASALQSGAFRGITLSAPDSNPAYYARFTGFSGGRPRLRITYAK